MKRSLQQWLLWTFAMLATTLLLLSLRDRLDKAHVAMVYLLVVLGSSAAGGRVIGLTIAGVAFIAFNYLFLPPYYTLVIADPLDWLVLVTFLITGVVATQLLARASRTTDIAIARALEVDRLATLGAETLAAASASDALKAIAEVIRSTLDATRVELYRRAPDGAVQLSTMAHDPCEPASRDNSSKDESLRAWFGERVRSAVRLPDGTTRLDPTSLVGLEVREIARTLDVRDHRVGVLRLVFTRSCALTADSARLLDALSYYAALGVERVRLEVTAEHAEAERRMESLRSALLMAVSHDLRTPLTTIKALAHEISASSPSSAARIIEAEADRLDIMVGDLLDLSRIQAGAVQPIAAINTIDDLIGAALQRTHGAIGARAVAVTLPDELLLARCDLTQTVRILVNLLENAAKYSPTDRGIEISARRDLEYLIVEVADEGPGIAEREVPRIFEPFYRPAGTSPDVRGTGLGLSIARGLAEAQGGSLRYRARVGGGSVFVLQLPSATGPAS